MRTLAMGTKTCPKCGVERELDDFPRDKSKASGRKSSCRDCDNAKSSRYYLANRDIVLVKRAALPKRPVKVRFCHCGARTPSGRHRYCDSCREPARAAKERLRLRGRDSRTSTERGYGYEHQLERKRWAPLVATGEVRCARGAGCLYAVNGMPALIEAGTPWDLGHDDYDRSRHSGPEHPRCNRATAGRKRRKSRVW